VLIVTIPTEAYHGLGGLNIFIIVGLVTGDNSLGPTSPASIPISYHDLLPEIAATADVLHYAS